MHARKIIAAAAVMALQAIVLAMTSPETQAAAVYRCHEGQDAAGRRAVKYQAAPCPSGTGAAVLHLAGTTSPAGAPAATPGANAAASVHGQEAPRKRRAKGTPAAARTSRLAGQQHRNAPAPALASSNTAGWQAGPHAARTPKAKGGGSRRQATPAPMQAGALTRHRFGERPFEHLGQQVTPPPSERRRHARAPGARAARAAQGDESGAAVNHRAR